MNPPAVGALAVSYFRIGLGSFGGGLTALPVFAAELVERRRWFTAAELEQIYALAQSVPGVIMINAGVISGLRLAGLRGAMVAAASLALPSFLVILGLASLYHGGGDQRWLAAALGGVRPAVVAILAAVVIRLGRAHLRSWAAGLGFLLAAFLIWQRWVSPVVLLLCSGGLGLLWSRLRPPVSPP